MKTKLFFLLLLLLFTPYIANNQEVKTANTIFLRESAQRTLLNLPILKLPDRYKGAKAPELPPVLDNSRLPFFRPIFMQEGPSCGQASAIGYAFTYEINRLRGLASNSSMTQYPPHFAWNWENGGEGWYGVSFMHSFEVLKSVGTPNIKTFGGFVGPYGNDETYYGRYWMSGYDKYYQAMKNRLQEVYRIDVSTMEGIQTLKYWLFDHLDGSTYGGVANFYANVPGPDLLPEGTPEAGKHVTTYWGEPTHAMTICGYNDSIRWDYNGDGLYTNDIDINGDGQINLKDREIGGFIFANSWGVGNGDNGFHYMTYRSCVDSIPVNGSIKNGIWNSEVYVQYVKENTEPKLTAKITIKYTHRGKLRVRMGYSTNLNATQPDYVMMFPILNYQGGNHYMQGGNHEYDKTIEFGLDISPMMDMIPNGTKARFFLLVDENDPEDEDEGEIIGFSLMDYTGGEKEIPCSQSHIPLENGTTSLWIDHTVEYDAPNITTEILKGATAGQEYYYQVEAKGGTPPYFYTIDKNYTVQTGSREFIPINGTNYEDTLILQNLEFDFPFYGEKYHQLNISEKGYVYFDEYLTDEYSHFYQLFQENKVIAPFLLSDAKDTIVSEEIRYQGNSDSACIRWKSHISNEPSSVLNFSLTLYKNGEIGFSYGETAFETTQWIAGLSSGKDGLYQFTQNSTFPEIPDNYFIRFSPPALELDSLQLSPGGILSGMFKEEYMDKSMRIKVRDASNLKAVKNLSFSSEAFSLLQITDFSTRNPYDTSILGYGDTVAIKIKVENKGMLPESKVKLKIRSSSPYIKLQTEELELGDFDTGESKEIEDAFTFVIAGNIPASLRFNINAILETQAGESWEKQFFFRATSPILKAGFNKVVNDNDSTLSPGDVADILIDITNTGVIPVQDISIHAYSPSEDVTLNISEGLIDSLRTGETKQVLFNISIDENAAKELFFPVNISISNERGYHSIQSVILVAGKATESFETGDFSQFHWQTSSSYSENSWSIVSTNSFDGEYAAQSKYNQYGISELSLKENFLVPGNIEFYYFLNSPEVQLFYKNGSSSPQACTGYGDWFTKIFPVNKGQETIRWLSFFNDSTEHALLDHISFPLTGAENPVLRITPTGIQDSIFGSTGYEKNIFIENLSDGNIYFSTLIVDSLDNTVDWAKISPGYGKLARGESIPCKIHLNTQDLAQGISKAILRIFDHAGKHLDIPLQFTLWDVERNACNDFAIASFPNPFRDKIKIDFTLREEQNIEIQIFDLQGNIIKSGYLGKLKTGTHNFYWNGENDQGVQLPSGVYFFVISSEKSVCSQKLVKIR